MRPSLWEPPVEPSEAEAKILKRVKRAKLFVFLRHHRHEIFTQEFQHELAQMYKDQASGHPPVWPALLALALVVQAYTGVSDDEVIEAMWMDRRWQLVLDCLDAEHPPFSKGTLVAFRTRLIETEMDRRLLERTIEIAKTSGGFGAAALRAALDSSPLWGAARVEDTYNLLGHALRKALGVIADHQGREVTEVAREAKAEIVSGSSLKAALDLDWDDPQARTQALTQILMALDGVEAWVEQHPQVVEQKQVGVGVSAALEAARQVVRQDVTSTAGGDPTLVKGVAKDRRIAIEDEQMRHGRKSRAVRFDGYKRHVLRDLDTGLIPAVGLTPANVPEASVTPAITADLDHQQISLTQVHIDRAYLSSSLVRDRDERLEIRCKAWPVRSGPLFDKTAFTIDWEREVLTCPNQIEMPVKLGGVVQFPAQTCAECPLNALCTNSAQGRSVTVHREEKLLRELRVEQGTSQGRATLRERVGVEHALAHIGHWQGDRARYRGTRKNLFDLRRSAVVHNLHIFARNPDLMAQAVNS